MLWHPNEKINPNSYASKSSVTFKRNLILLWKGHPMKCVVPFWLTPPSGSFVWCKCACTRRGNVCQCELLAHFSRWLSAGWNARLTLSSPLLSCTKTLSLTSLTRRLLSYLNFQRILYILSFNCVRTGKCSKALYYILNCFYLFIFLMMT